MAAVWSGQAMLKRNASKGAGNKCALTRREESQRCVSKWSCNGLSDSKTWHKRDHCFSRHVWMQQPWLATVRAAKSRSSARGTASSKGDCTDSAIMTCKSGGKSYGINLCCVTAKPSCLCCKPPAGLAPNQAQHQQQTCSAPADQPKMDKRLALLARCLRTQGCKRLEFLAPWSLLPELLGLTWLKGI